MYLIEHPYFLQHGCVSHWALGYDGCYDSVSLTAWSDCGYKGNQFPAKSAIKNCHYNGL